MADYPKSAGNRIAGNFLLDAYKWHLQRDDSSIFLRELLWLFTEFFFSSLFMNKKKELLYNFDPLQSGILSISHFRDGLGILSLLEKGCGDWLKMLHLLEKDWSDVLKMLHLLKRGHRIKLQKFCLLDRGCSDGLKTLHLLERAWSDGLETLRLLERGCSDGLETWHL